jgi:rsbT co-antagonist protein RsbR
VLERSVECEKRLAALDLVAIPVWLHDYEQCRIAWANQAALEMWRAESREALRHRDVSNLSESMRTRVDRLMRLVREGRTAQEQMTVYPRGNPVTAMVHFSGTELDDGRLGLLMQCVVMDAAPDPYLLRGIEALRHTAAIVILLSGGGEVLMQNPAAFQSWFADPGVAETLMQTVAAGEVFQSEAAVLTRAGEHWYSIEARSTTDPATGKAAVLVHAVDETVRRGAERTAKAQAHLIHELQRTLDLVERQRVEIVALSAPILDIRPGAVAVPIIGSLGQERSAELTERLLKAVAARRAHAVILDLTGAVDLDAMSAGHLMKLVRALRLLGARAIITGIQPSSAQVLVRSGADFSGLFLLHSLSEGIRVCLREQGPPH